MEYQYIVEELIQWLQVDGKGANAPAVLQKIKELKSLYGMS